MNTVQIYLRNDSSETQPFFFFQQPVVSTSSGSVYSHSLLSASLRGKGSGAVLIYEQSSQLYAGAETLVFNRQLVRSATRSSGTMTVIQAITSSSNAANSTDLLTAPLGLTTATNDPSVANDAFQIVTPVFDPALETYQIGLAVERKDRPPILSSFIKAESNRHLQFTPTTIFYVQIGTFPAGECFDFASASRGAARCDGTTGVAHFKVVYNANGTWTVNDQT